jgi:8-oxo-dGTP diphosphatase
VARRPTYAVTVDVVVFRVAGSELQVLLVERGSAPYAGGWALPGGFKEPDETLETAARRELAEETGLRLRSLSQLKAYGDPGRDPRGNVVTVAFLAIVARHGKPRGGDDAASATFQPVATVLSGDLPLAFDHLKIVRDAVAALRERIESSDLAARFLAATFTLAELRQVYAAIIGKPIDAAQFRNRMRRVGWLEATGEDLFRRV